MPSTTTIRTSEASRAGCRTRLDQTAFLVRTSMLSIVIWSTGCSGPALNRARHDFYSGRVVEAGQVLEQHPVPERDEVLYLMERGVVRQAMGRYEASVEDLVQAYELIEKYEPYSLSEGGASFVVNDNVQRFTGAPYERTMVSVFNALNYAALGQWDHTAVMSRRAVYAIEQGTERGYPDDAFSRYIAGLGFEWINDLASAQQQYRLASSLIPHLRIDEKTGRITPVSDDPEQNHRSSIAPAHTELLCIVLLGRAGGEHPSGDGQQPDDYVEVLHNGERLGRSYTLTDTLDLAFTTEQREAARKTAKAVGRIALKEGIAQSIENENLLLAELVRLVLIGVLEQPDLRKWETLPRLLQIARVPCPDGLTHHELRVRAGSRVVMQRRIEAPLTKRRNMYISLFRDLPLPPSP